MKRLAVLFLVPLLSGCYTDQEKQEAACELASSKFTDEHSKKAEAGVTREELMVGVEETALKEIVLNTACMRAHGYRFVHSPNCPNLPIDEHITTAMELQSENPACYEPIGWGQRQVFEIEMLFR